jgi:hypothetical protein
MGLTYQQWIEVCAFGGAAISVLGFIAVMFTDVRVGKVETKQERLREHLIDVCRISGDFALEIRDGFGRLESMDDSQTKRLNDGYARLIRLEQQQEVTTNRLEMTETAGILVGANLSKLYEALLANGTFRVVERPRTKVKKIRERVPRRRRA